MTRLDWKIALVMGAVFIALNQVAVERAPLPWVDEVILNDPARELAFTGHFRSAVFSDHPQFREKYLWHPPAQQLVTVLVYKVFGFGIRQTREPGIVFGGGAVVALYFLAMQLGGRRRAAALAALMFALEPKVVQVARSGRMDTQSLCFALLGAGLFFRARNSENRGQAWIAAAGLAIGLAGLAHPVASFWALALGLLILLENNPSRIRKLIVFGAASAVPVLAWLVYALSDYDLFLQQFLFHGRLHLVHGSVLARLGQELGRYSQDLYPEAPLIAAYAAALIWLGFAPHLPPRLKLRILLPFLLIFALNGIIMMKTGGYYYLYANVWLTLAAGLFLDHYLPAGLTRPQGRRQIAALAFTALLALDLAGAGLGGRYLIWAGQWRARDPRPIEDEIARLIPAGSVVIGPPKAWYAVVQAGSTLRFGRKPRPRLHDYFICEERNAGQAPPGSVKIGEVGQPLPPVFGRFQSGYDYRMQIWKLPKAPRPPTATEKPP